jgi:hypothetical protein
LSRPRKGGFFVLDEFCLKCRFGKPGVWRFQKILFCLSLTDAGFCLALSPIWEVAKGSKTTLAKNIQPKVDKKAV